MARAPDGWSLAVPPGPIVDRLISDDARDTRRPEVDPRVRYGPGAWPGKAGARPWTACGPWV